MLISNDMLKKALENFPRWMDIRKRHFSSNGGLLLKSISEEVSEIRSSISEYIDSFFISNYKDKAEEIVDFVYKANVGIIDIRAVELIDPTLQLTEDIYLFYKSENYAYYQDGFIFVKDNIKTIIYKIGEYVSEANTEKTHVWNAYDEFAVFIGIRRLQDETNRELFDRIIETAKKPVGSSEDALKHSIKSALLNIVPELSLSDINIRRPTAFDLEQYYDEFESNLEKLAKVNRDVLRHKKWDLDRWNYSFKRINYIPHVWDVILDEYKNGIGDNDDLMPFLLDGINDTSANISFYQKTEDAITSYIRNSHIEDKLILPIVKYNDILNPLEANYKITASEVYEADNNLDPIMIESYQKIRGTHNRKIEDLISSVEDMKDIRVSIPGRLNRGKYYRVRFSPKDKYNTMLINECHVENSVGEIPLDPNGNIMNYISDIRHSNFKIINGVLTNTKAKLVAKRKYDYVKTDNIIDTTLGLRIDDISENAELRLSLKNCENELLKVLYNCEFVKVPRHNINMENFYYSQEHKAYLSDTVNGEKRLVIDIEGNHCKLNINSGQCNIIVSIDGEIDYVGPPLYKNGKGYYETKRYNVPRDIEITIVAIGRDVVSISDIEYNKYILSLSTAKGVLISNPIEDELYTIPSSRDNELIINMRTFTSFSPNIETIYIGSVLTDEDIYETDLINCFEDLLDLKISTNAYVELFESEAPFDECIESETVKITRDYNTHRTYTATSNEAYIILDTSSYSNIENVTTRVGSIEVKNFNSKTSYILRMLSGEVAEEVTINGEYNKFLDCVELNSIIIRKSKYNPSTDKLYYSGLTKNFIVERADHQEDVTVEYKDLQLTGADFTRLVNLPAEVQAAFITKSNDSDYTLISTEKEGTFDRLYLYPKKAKEYIAYNNYTTYTYRRSGIKIVNTFNNGYIDNKLMIYQVESLQPEDYKVYFDNNSTWTVNKKFIALEFLKTPNGEDFNITKKIINKDIRLETTIALDEVYSLENNENIELAQYTVAKNDDLYEVIYRSDINNPEYDKAEFIDIKVEGFNKLRYSNVIDIKYIGTDISEGLHSSIDNSKYELLKDEGIILWNDEELISNQSRLYVVYSIKKAIAIKYNIDYLYEKVHYPISAYRKFSTVLVNKIRHEDRISLLKPELGDLELSDIIKDAYLKADIVSVECKEPGFSCEKVEDILIFKKVESKNTIAVKSGWYYLNGREYYMFASNKPVNTLDDEYTYTQEVIKIDDKLYFHKSTVNHIKNSKLLTNSFGNVFSIKNFNKIRELKGSSRINALTACDNYNNWNTFLMDMKIVKGLNGSGIYFTPYKNYEDASYAVLELTDFLSDKNYISLYNPNDLKVFIGIEKKTFDIELNDTINITYLSPISTKTNDNIYYHYFSHINDEKKYLVVIGEGLIDDIILQDGVNPNVDLHKKNISSIEFDIKESTTTGVTSRFFIEQDRGNRNDGAEIDNMGYIVNSPNIDWDITKYITYTSEKDWLNNFTLDNIGIVKINDKDCILSTSNSNGNITSKPIYIGNVNTIKSIIYKINDIPLNPLKDFKTTIYQGQTINGSFSRCETKFNSMASSNSVNNLIYPYIKLSVDIPQNKVIDKIEIFIEYKSTERNSPIEKINSNGEFISKVLDTQNSSDYALKDIGIEEITSDVELFIRGAREGSSFAVWTEWKRIIIDSKSNLRESIFFEDYRYFQFKVVLKSRNARAKIKYLELEVK